MLFAILNLDSCNLLKTLDHASFAVVRKGIIRCIMATDMAKHGEHLQIFNKILPSFSLEEGEHRAQLLSVIIKCADISTEVRPPHIAGMAQLLNYPNLTLYHSRCLGEQTFRRIFLPIR
jgi:high affinity cGMP-specific 3',5'-cyclic phosphodiesterase 9